MKQLTIRGVDEELHSVLRENAEKYGLSINRYVLGIIRESVGFTNGSIHHEIEFDDLDHLAGTWTEDEYQDFQDILNDQRQVDSKLWP